MNALDESRAKHPGSFHIIEYLSSKNVPAKYGEHTLSKRSRIFGQFGVDLSHTGYEYKSTKPSPFKYIDKWTSESPSGEPRIRFRPIKHPKMKYKSVYFLDGKEVKESDLQNLGIPEYVYKSKTEAPILYLNPENVLAIR